VVELVAVIEVGPAAKYHAAAATRMMIARTKTTPLMSMDVPQ
jgi:hypothetical protein